jgi:rod shape-determining protein MreD
MKAFRFPTSPKDRFRPRINRAPSPLLARTVPWASIMLGSLVPAWLVIASAPLLPPLGFLMLVAWRQLRPGLLPVWAGLPLGLFDDLYSGQPMGNAVLLWSLAVIVLDVVEARLPWRNFLVEWLVAVGLIVAYLVLSLAIANLTGGATPIEIIIPQIILSTLLYPAAARLVAGFDRFRLLPFRKVG